MNDLSTREELSSNFREDDIMNVLTKEQCDKIIAYINDRYYRTWLIQHELKDLKGYYFKGQICPVDFRLDAEDYSPAVILVKRDGTFYDDNFTEVNIIDDDNILFTKKFYKDNYEEIEEQGILNSDLEVVFKGDLGNVENAKKINDCLILEKSKYSDIEKDKIRVLINELSEEEKIDCPECGSDAYWDRSEGCYICECCDFTECNEGSNPYEEWWLSPIQLMAAEDFKSLINSPKVADEDVLAEKLQQLEGYDFFDDEYEEQYREEKKELDKYLEEKKYAVFSLRLKQYLLPYQELSVKVKYEAYSPKIYLKDDAIAYEILYEKRLKEVEWYATNDFSCNKNEDSYMEIFHCGEKFTSIFDRFHSGRFVGQKLASVFMKYPKKVLELQQKNKIFICTNALHQLWQKFHKSDKDILLRLIGARDVKLLYLYGTIKCVEDRILGRIYSGMENYGQLRAFCLPVEEYNYYAGLSVKQILDIDPLYIIRLINNRKIKVSRDLLYDLDALGVLDEQLKEAIEYNVMEQEAEKAEQEYRYKEWAYRSEYESIEEGYRDAFEGDPEAEWNID